MNDGGVVNLINEVFVVDQRVERAEGFGDAFGNVHRKDVHVIGEGNADDASENRDVDKPGNLGGFLDGEHVSEDFRHVEEESADDRKHGENRERPPHGDRRFMRVRMAAIFAKERHKPGAEDVKGCHSRGDGSDPVHPGSVGVRSGENRILAIEARERRNAGDGK